MISKSGVLWRAVHGAHESGEATQGGWSGEAEAGTTALLPSPGAACRSSLSWLEVVWFIPVRYGSELPMIELHKQTE